jgi:hypothetical protein
MSKNTKNTRKKRGGRMLMDFNKSIIPYYSPISSKGGSKRKNKKNKLRTRRRK